MIKNQYSHYLRQSHFSISLRGRQMTQEDHLTHFDTLTIVDLITLGEIKLEFKIDLNLI